MIFKKKQTPCDSGEIAPKVERSRCERLPRICLISFITTGVCGLLTLIFRLSPAFSDWFNRYISQAFRFVFAKLTSFLPFSFAEILLMLSPLILTALIVYAIKTHVQSWRSVGMYLLKVLSVVCVFAILFVTNFAAGYYGVTLSDASKLDLDRKKVSAEELYITALHLIEDVKREEELVEFAEKDFSIMPYSISEMNQKLLDAYDNFCADHEFIAHFDSRVKPVILSEAMSYTHITGVYSYFSGEANINVNFPDYTIPYTAAHEMAHQRGIAREDEANFIAFLVCISSDDAYIRYSGYLNLYEYVASSLYSADPELYFEARGQLPMTVRYEMSAYSKFFDKYRDSVAGEVSGTINDLYLKGNGTEGTRSYGLVVDLAVAYDKKQHP
jgi:hypothetical protein